MQFYRTLDGINRASDTGRDFLVQSDWIEMSESQVQGATTPILTLAQKAVAAMSDDVTLTLSGVLTLAATLLVHPDNEYLWVWRWHSPGLKIERGMAVGSL